MTSTFALEAVLASVREVTGRVFHPREVHAREREHAWVIELGDAMVAFVAKDAASRARLVASRRILTRIGPRLSFETPRPLGPLDRVEPCDLRTRTRGAVGMSFRERVLADNAHAARVAAWVANALAELHAALAGIELDAFGLVLPSWPPSGEQLAACAPFADEPSAAVALCSRWDAWLSARSRRRDVLVHGDVDLHNFGWDPATGLPISLFDFHEAGRGPRVLDFAAMPEWGPRALERVLERYAVSSGDAGVTLADVQLAHAVRAIAGLGPGASETRRAAARAAIAACA